MEFGVCWIRGGLLWIPTALSTLRPTTSPRLSDVRLDFTLPATAYRSVEVTVGDSGKDLRRVVGEVARIKRQFEGAVSVVVLREPGYETALDALNVMFHSFKVAGNSQRC